MHISILKIRSIALVLGDCLAYSYACRFLVYDFRLPETLGLVKIQNGRLTIGLNGSCEGRILEKSNSH